MKTRKWSSRTFYHIIDVAIVNAYILYHRIYPVEKIQLPDFRCEVAESLCFSGAIPQKRSVGRPSLSKPRPKLPKKAYFPTEDVRYDQMGHWCVFRDRSGKKQCKYPTCTSDTQAYCVKCDLNFCNSSLKNCFFDFHQKSSN